MTTKGIRHGNAIRAEHRHRNKNKRKLPFPKIYSNSREDYELYESDEDQVNALKVETEISTGHFS